MQGKFAKKKQEMLFMFLKNFCKFDTILYNHSTAIFLDELTMACS
jgi:hypothetical protein